MSHAGVLNPHNPDYDPFLYAFVGKDRAGSAVTVLSALARLELDPWKEAAELASLRRDAAGARLGLLLSRCRDVPALVQDSQSVAQKLAGLLPDRKGRTATDDDAPARRFSMSPGMIWAILAVLFLVSQMMFSGTSGFGQ